MPRIRSLTVLAAVFACAGPDSPSPRLVLVDSIVLEQGDTTFLGRPGGLAIVDDGFWVADMQVGRLTHYDRSGGYRRSIGRQGDGPGEFNVPFRLAYAPPGRLDVLDVGRFVVTGVDAGDGTHLYRHSLGPQNYGTSIAYRGDSLLVGGASIDPVAGALWLNLTTGEITAAVPAPEGRERLVRNLEYATAAQVRDGVVAVWQGLYLARLSGWDGSNIELAIPARTRSVPPEDLLEQLLSGAFELDSAGVTFPVPLGASTLPNDGAAFVHIQPRWSEDGSRFEFEGGFLSVINAAADSACVDAPIELRSEELPVIGFRGDTLYLLEQVVEDNEVTAMVRSFEISTEGCEWMPVVRYAAEGTVR